MNHRDIWREQHRVLCIAIEQLPALLQYRKEVIDEKHPYVAVAEVDLEIAAVLKAALSVTDKWSR